MEFTIDATPDNKKLLRLMVDKDPLKAMAARVAFAAFITEPILNVIESEPVIGNMFTTYTYDEGTPATIPLAPLFDIKQADFIKVWAQSRPGGMATSSNSDVSELAVMTAALFSALSFPLNFIRNARVDVVAAYLQRAAQEFLYKQEANSFAVLAAAVMQSTYLKNGVATQQILRTTTQNVVLPNDISRLFTLMSRVNSSFTGGTPAGAGRAITSLLGSPEFMEQIRNMAFNPLNTTTTTYPLGGPNQFRDEIYSAGINPSIYGIELITVYDMGQPNLPYNILAGQYAGSLTYQGYNQGAATVFSPGSEQLTIGVDRRQKFLARLVENNPDDSSTLAVTADNQWSNREETIGFTMKLREGRVALDGRNCVGLVW